jgi:Zn-dependent protease
VGLSLLASLFHEIGHLLVMAREGVRPEEITVYPFGFDIRTAPHVTSYRSDLFICAAGAAANALAVCASAAVLFFLGAELSAGAAEGVFFFLSANLALALINLLPHPVLDGGGMLRALLLSLMSPEKCERICRTVGECVIFPMACAVLYLLFYGKGNPTLYLLCAYLVWSLAAEGNKGK